MNWWSDGQVKKAKEEAGFPVSCCWEQRDTKRPGAAAINPERLKPREPWGYPAISIGPRERMTKAEFEALRVASDVEALPGFSYEFFKVLVGGRWHVCSRQAHFGQLVTHVNPIVVIVPAAVSP